MKKKVSDKLFEYVTNFFFQDFSPKFRVDKLKNLMDFFYVIFEKISIEFEILYSNYINMYEELVEKELNLLNIKKDDKILVIGCGSLPATSILIAQKTNNSVHCIDIDKKAISKARFLTKKIGIKNMSFDAVDGISSKVDDYDIIFLLYGVKKQKEMINYLSSNMKNNSYIIFRTTEESLHNQVGGEYFLEQYFKIKGKVESENIYLNISYLLKKE